MHKIILNCLHQYQPERGGNPSFRFSSDITTSELHIYAANIDNATKLLNLELEVLNTEEIIHAKRYKQEEDKRRHLLGKILSKTILSKYLEINPIDVAFENNNYGKLSLANRVSNLHFNVSHSGKYVALIVSNQIVGIDIEKYRQDFDYSLVYSSCFTPKELTSVEQSNNKEYPLSLWAMKEAFIKMLGVGLTDDIINIPALEGKHIIPAENNLITEASAASFSCKEGYGCAFAVAAHKFKASLFFAEDIVL